MIKKTSFMKAVVFSFKISFKASPCIMCFRMFITLLLSCVPFANAISIKNILNSIVNMESKIIWFWFIILAVTQLVTAVLSKVYTYISQIHSDKIVLYVSKSIIDKINKLNISYFDNTESYNEVKNVTHDANSIPGLVWEVMTLIKGGLQLCSAVIILMRVIWWFPFLICIACLPNFIFDKYYSVKLYEWNRASTNDVRKINYLYAVLTEKYFAKDLRVNSLENQIKQQYNNRWEKWFKEKMAISQKQFWFSFITLFLPHIISLLFTAYIIWGSMRNSYNVGDITYYISVMGQLTAATFIVTNQITTIIESRKKLDYYEKFLNWDEYTGGHEGIKIDTIDKIEFASVWFKYPGNEQFTLRDISFIIRKGEKVAFIGKNGSGKSTIIKLILGLYYPTKGTIYINNIDIRNIDIQSLYKACTIMFQDYVNYSFTLKNNLSNSDVYNDHSDEELYDACKKGNSYDFVRFWENGLNTYLTRSFDEMGQELSSGQWQRLSLSRTFVKDASLLIYDEPAASLDIEAEDHLYNELVYNHPLKTLILISHRMSYIKDMNLIVVMDSGKIIEEGTHDELMKHNGLYANLYKVRQKSN